jgi:hypothetical protein
MTFESAREYLTPTKSSFWQWRPDEWTIVWKNGTTIAFAEELAVILERFGSRGLPAMDCVVLVLAVLRDSWADLNAADQNAQQLLPYLLSNRLSPQDLQLLIDQLDRVHGLTHGLRQSISNKAQIAEMALESLPGRCSQSDATIVIQRLRERHDGTLSEQCPTRSDKNIKNDLLKLLDTLPRIDQQSIRNRLQTGIDRALMIDRQDSIQEAIDDTSYSDAVEARELIETLMKESESYAVGRMARDLMAALYRPARLKPEKSLHLEGYCDITNRGTLDRLLVSELAYEDETLAIRVANGEALYMRREVPPTRQAIDRCMLIDSGIRSWGTPRVFSAAIGLALTATAPNDAKVFAWRTTETGIDRSYFVDQSGMTGHMGHLHAALHPGDAIESFCSAKLLACPDAEVFLILSRDAWNDDGFRRSLRESELACLTVTTIDRKGELEIMEVTKSGIRSSKKMNVALIEMESKKPETGLIVPDQLPKIFECSPFPIRISCSRSKMFPLDRSLMLGRASDRQLVLWDSASLGAIVLKATMPIGDVLAAGVHPAREYFWCVWGSHQNTQRWVLRFRFQDYSLMSEATFEVPRGILHFEMQESALLITSVWRKDIQAMSFDNGSTLATVAIGTKVTSSVFLDEGRNWMSVSFNGLGFDTLRITFGKLARSDEILFVAPSPLQDGFLALTTSKQLLHSKGTSEPFTLPNQLTIPILDGGCKIFSSGRWIGFATGDGYFALEVNDQGKPVECKRFDPKNLERSHQDLVWSTWTTAKQETYRNRFSRIGMFRGQLTLTRNQQWLSLHYRQDKNCCWAEWSVQASDKTDPIESVATFKFDKELSSDLGFRVEVARSGNIEAMLDSRGLLHLRRLSGHEPELTIVLREGKTSGWFSDECWFGTDYHCGTDARSSIQNLNLDYERIQSIVDEWQTRGS